jgi:hypothetical protein
MITSTLKFDHNLEFDARKKFSIVYKLYFILNKCQIRTHKNLEELVLSVQFTQSC